MESWRRQLRISTHVPTHSAPTHSSHVPQIHSHTAQLFVIHNVPTPNTVKMEKKYTQTCESSESCPQSAAQTCLKPFPPRETQQNVQVHWFYRCDGQVFSSAAHSSEAYSSHSCCLLHWQLWNDKSTNWDEWTIAWSSQFSDTVLLWMDGTRSHSGGWTKMEGFPLDFRSTNPIPAWMKKLTMERNFIHNLRKWS